LHSLQGFKVETLRYGREVEVYRVRIRYEGEVEVCTEWAFDVEILEHCTEEGWM
jgi:hypothetical protein